MEKSFRWWLSRTEPTGVVHLSGKNRFPAMHALRLFCALLVVWDHAHYIVGLSPDNMLPGIDPGTFAVWTFFFLSGFLVTNSWIHRADPARFAVHRAARTTHTGW